MYYKNSFAYGIAVFSLLLCAACGSHKKPLQQQQPVERQYATSVMQIIHARVDGVECAACADDVIHHLKKVPGVQMATFVGDYNACEHGYFSFYFPADQQFDLDAFNATIQADGFSMKLLTQ